MIKLYTTHCPQCKILESKLEKKNIKYEAHDDIEEMKQMGFKGAPVIQQEDGTILNFAAAVKWVNSL